MKNSASSSRRLSKESDRTTAPHEASKAACEISHTLPSTSPPPSIGSQPSHCSSLLPPLDRCPQTGGDSTPTPLPKLKQSHGEPLAQPTKPPRGIAVAVFNRLVKTQYPGLPSQVVSRQAAPPPATPPPSAVGERSSAATTTSAATTATQSPDGELSSRGSLVADELPPRAPPAATENDNTAEEQCYKNTRAVLPWWKRILIDGPYRQRLMQLSTEEYRREMKLLQCSPEVISGKAGMEKKKICRERRWWDDELAEDATPVHHKMKDQTETLADWLQRTEAAASVDAKCASSYNDVEDAASRSMKEEVDKTIVMAQHVVLNIPPHSSVSSTFSLQHPRAIIDASALKTIRGVALGGMPPVQQVHDQEWQEAAIEAHLSKQRRLSYDMPFAAKRNLAKDIISGREEVPMQTAITDALLETFGAQKSQGPPTIGSPDLSCSTLSSGTGEGSSSDSANRSSHESFSSAQPSSRPGTPPGVRRRLPPNNDALIKAEHDLKIATVKLHLNSFSPCPMPPRAAAATSKNAETSVSASNGQGNKDDCSSCGAQIPTEMCTLEHQLRRQEAAMACTDGTENLYGLQYIWRLPLPPSGFIRVTPDPRYAMWPDDTPHSAERSPRRFDASTADDGSASAGRRSAGHNKMLSSRYYQREMRRLARRVNRRTEELQWTHEIGLHHVCYNDLPMLTDSDNTSVASSCLLPMAVHAHRTASPTTNSNQKAAPRFSMSVVRQLGQKRRAPADSATRRHRKRAPRASIRGRAAKPIYDGALNVNIYAAVVDRRRPPGGKGKRASESQNSEAQGVDDAEPRMPLSDVWGESSQRDASSSSSSSSETVPARPRNAAAAAPTRLVFLGCYRQSRLLIHYKIYCRALHEEARVRCGPPLTHVAENASMSRAATNPRNGQQPTESSVTYDADTSSLLRGVPMIPYPVLRLQAQTPTLRQPHTRRIPAPSTIGEACCWEGLFPSARVDYAWCTLRESVLVQQALRDIFEDLPHDKEGLLDKRTFVLFTLQLLELFFPTHLGPTVHVAIAEEEWVYRGTTEHVGPHTFHEKFFGFPFMLLRDPLDVSEAELVEFWSILRVCLRAQAEQARPRLPGEAVTSSRELLASLHLLVPLNSFSPTQLQELIAHPPPFDPVVYDRFCLLNEAYHSDPVVRRAPRAQQCAVARARVEQQLRLRQAQQALGGAARAAAKSKVGLSLPDLLDGCGPATSRIGIENAVQREREEQRRCAEVQAKRVLLEQSIYYKRRQQHIHVQETATLSNIDYTSSSWELHRSDVYELPSKSYCATRKDLAGAESIAAQKADMEDALLEYLEGVPTDVFSGRVSLRERYLLHTEYQRERHDHMPPWLQKRSVNRTNPSSMTTKPGAVSSPRATPPPDPNFEAETRRFLGMMEREEALVEEQQHIAAADHKRLIRSEHGSAASEGREKSHHPITTSYAAGAYPLRPVPRTISSIIMPSDQRARVHILEQEDYKIPDAIEPGSCLRKTSGSSTCNGVASFQPHRVPSRIRMKAPSSSHLVRDSQERHRLAKRASVADHSSKYHRNGTRTAASLTTMVIPSAGTAAGEHQQLKNRLASRVNLKRNASKTARHKCAPQSPLSASAPLSPSAHTAAGAAAQVVPSSPSPASSRPTSRVGSIPGSMTRLGRPLGSARNSSLVKLISNISSVDANADNRGIGSNDGQSRGGVAMLLELSQSFLSEYGDRTTRNTSFTMTGLSTDQKHPTPATRPTSQATHYAGRLRARQRRQQQYQLQFNSSGKPLAALKR